MFHKNKSKLSTLKVLLVLISMTLVIGIYFVYSYISDVGENSVSLQEVVASYNNPKIRLLDLRSKKELEKTGIIPGAIHIDYYKDDFKEKLSELDKNKTYIIYCHSGVRSKRTDSVMQELGFRDVRDYTPGIKGWLAGGGETQVYK